VLSVDNHSLSTRIRRDKSTSVASTSLESSSSIPGRQSRSCSIGQLRDGRSGSARCGGGVLRVTVAEAGHGRGGDGVEKN
jgi:hypothetical protein